MYGFVVHNKSRKNAKISEVLEVSYLKNSSGGFHIAHWRAADVANLCMYGMQPSVASRNNLQTENHLLPSKHHISINVLHQLMCCVLR